MLFRNERNPQAYSHSPIPLSILLTKPAFTSLLLFLLKWTKLSPQPPTPQPSDPYLKASLYQPSPIHLMPRILSNLAEIKPLTWDLVLAQPPGPKFAGQVNSLFLTGPTMLPRPLQACSCRPHQAPPPHASVFRSCGVPGAHLGTPPPLGPNLQGK